MGIAFSELMAAPEMASARLLTDEAGLGNIIHSVGILDYEYAEQGYDQFFEGDLVLTSMLFAKDDPALLAEAVARLADSGVSVLGIKDVYYPELPGELIRLANQRGLAVFRFGKNLFMETIIIAAHGLLRRSEQEQQKQENTDRLLEESRPDACLALALAINSHFEQSAFAVYFAVPHRPGGLVPLVRRLSAAAFFTDRCALYPYRGGLLAVITYPPNRKINPSSAVQKLLAQGGTLLSGTPVGVGDPVEQLHRLGTAIQQALYAGGAFAGRGAQVCYFRDMGMLKVLLPHRSDPWFDGFSQDILGTIRDYDAKNGANLMQTALSYLKHDHSVKRTAQHLYQHENTVRYRVQKLRELLRDPTLIQLSLAIRYAELSGEEL